MNWDESELSLNEIEESSYPAYSDDIFEIENSPSIQCKYCSCSDPAALMKCKTCGLHFCNGSFNCSSSHIILHAAFCHHLSFEPCENEPIPSDEFKCVVCNKSFIFELGCLLIDSSSSLALVCRNKCLNSLCSTHKYSPANWYPIVKLDHIDEILVAVPNFDPNFTYPSANQIKAIETEKDAQEQLQSMLLEPCPDVFESIDEYAEIMENFVNHEKQLEETDILAFEYDDCEVSFDGYKCVINYSSSGFSRASFSHLVLSHKKTTNNNIDWSALCFVVEHTLSEITCIMLPAANRSMMTKQEFKYFSASPCQFDSNFSIRAVFNPVTFNTQLKAINIFKKKKIHAANHIIGKDLMSNRVFSCPKIETVKNYGLDHSQCYAAQIAIQSDFTLIQGPPGTGKSTTISGIVSLMLNNQKKQKILISAQTNLAADHIANVLGQRGVSVVRLYSKLREQLPELSNCDYSLDELIIKNFATERIKRLRADLEAHKINNRGYAELNNAISKYSDQVLSSASVHVTTLQNCSDKRIEHYKYSTLIIDEAAQPIDAVSLIPIAFFNPKRVVLVGDHLQLGPIVSSRQAKANGYETSMFTRLSNAGKQSCLLNVQYRMHPSISMFPSDTFYSGKLVNSESVTKYSVTDLHDKSFKWPRRDFPNYFHHVDGYEQMGLSGFSFLNTEEANFVVKTVNAMIEAKIDPKSVTILTPYIAQVNHIKSLLGDDSEVAVHTVYSFQGHESEIVLLSFVRANDNKSIGFIDDPRILNVALTRAKKGLICFGNMYSLSRSDYFNAMLSFYERKDCLLFGETPGSLSRIKLPPRMSNKKNVNTFLDNIEDSASELSEDLELSVE